jgi:hypothetical protein
MTSCPLWTPRLPDKCLVCHLRSLHVQLALLTPRTTDQVIGPRGLLATKARVVVTHSISFLSKFDQLVYIRRGIIIESGPYAKAAGDKGSHFYKLMSVHLNTIIGVPRDR